MVQLLKAYDRQDIEVYINTNVYYNAQQKYQGSVLTTSGRSR